MQSMVGPSLRLLVVGLNHRTAPLAVRENLAFAPAQVCSALADLTRRFPGTEAVILSTCNRVELYVARPVGTHPSRDALVDLLGRVHQVPVHEFQGHIYHHEDRQVVEHLFGVASSLDSMVVGETQILAQVKHAYQLACDAGTVGTTFHALFQRALAAAKDVHDSTQLAAGRLSIASVAVDLVRSVFDRFADKTVLCIGAGKMAGLMISHLQALAPRQIVLVNRSPQRAAELAAQVGGVAAPLDRLAELMVEADIVLTSTGSDEPIVHQGQFTPLIDYDAIDPLTGEKFIPALAPVQRNPDGSPKYATVKKYSDTLLIFTLKAHDPKYRDKQNIELTGKDGGAVQFNDTEKATRIAALMAVAASRQAEPDDVSDLI